MPPRLGSTYPMTATHAMPSKYGSIFLKFLIAYALVMLVLSSQGDEQFEHLHLLLDTSSAILSMQLALFMLGKQHAIERNVYHYLVIGFGITSGTEALHALTGIEWNGSMEWIETYAHIIRPATWPPTTYLLPLSLVGMLWLQHRKISLSTNWFVAGMVIAALMLLVLSATLPKYVDTGILGIQRPALVPLALLWLMAIVMCWRVRASHPLYEGLVWMGVLLFVSDLCMLYSTSPHEKFAMMAHSGKLFAYLFFYIVQVRIAAADSEARRQAEHELRDSEQRFRFMMETCPTAARIAKSDGRDVIFFNRSYVALINTTPEQASGVNPASYYAHPEDYRDILQRLGRGEQIFDRLVELNIPGAQTKWALASYLPIQYQGEPGVLGWFHDITERIQMERMKSEFISTVSHELRTPLTSIRGSLGLIMGGVAGELPAQAKVLVDIAHKNSERLIMLVNDILDMEKIEAGKMEFQLQAVELLPLVKQALEDNRAYAEQYKVAFALACEPTEARVYADPNRLQQVLANLLSNAAKFSPADDNVMVRVTRDGKNIRVAVSDHGSGIPEQFTGRIFQKFAQADSSDTRKKGGTGLGLSITKAIIEQMGGRIGFDSQPNVLTTFWVELPVWQENGLVATGALMAVSLKRVLICEDDQDIAALLRMMLEQAGLSADIAYNAEQAKQMLAQRSYAAMTLDLGLPDQKGTSLIRELRSAEATATLPILVVSAQAVEGHKELNGEAFSVVDWISKPINQEQLVQALRQAVGQVSPTRAVVLHIEDDADVVQVVAGIVGDVADVEGAATLADARRMLSERHYDLAILDMMLPDGSGKELLPLLSSTSPPIPVLVFSANEIGRNEIQEVASVLVKSKTDNAQLLETIKRLIGVQ